MSRLLRITLHAMCVGVLLGCGVARMLAQEPTQPPAKQDAAKQDAAKPEVSKEGEEEEENPFAPQPAPTLPPGMSGSDVSDPRYKLAPGLYDAG